MANDSFSATTQTSWFKRVGNAIAGVLIGILLFLGSFVLLTWNEGRAIKRTKTLETGAKEVMTVPADAVNPANQGRLVHLNGEAKPEGEATDPTFQLSAPVLALRRSVEMYQWSESKDSKTQQKLGGGEETVTTYTYRQEWSSNLIDSDEFQKPDGHQNPAEFPYPSRDFRPETVTVGAFTLPRDLLEQLTDFESFPLPADFEWSDSDSDAPVQRTGEGGLYVGADPQKPAIGDLRIKFEVIKPGPVTVLAAQQNSTFQPFVVRNLGDLYVLRAGDLSADAVFAAEAESNTILTWLLRLAGFVMMLIGLSLILAPLSVIASVIPFLGNIVGFGTGALAIIVALPLTLLTIAIAWIAFRPVLGIGLLVLAGVSIYLGARYLPRKKPATA